MSQLKKVSSREFLENYLNNMGKYDDMDMINGNGKGHNVDVNSLREKFKVKYSNDNGWDSNNLTDEQLNEIKSQKGYQSPGMICG